MRSFIPSLLATVCTLAVIAGPAQAQRGGWRGGNGSGSYGGGYYGHNNGYYGNYNGYYGNNYGYYSNYRGSGYYSYPQYSTYGGYYSPQYSYGNSQYYTTTPYTSDSMAYNTAPGQATTSSNYGDPTTNAQCWFKVIVLDPSTRLTIQDQMMQQTGTERVFYTPTLERGKVYPYTFRATTMENGREVTREKKVDVSAGQSVLINFADRSATVVPTGEAVTVMPSTAFNGEFVRFDGDQMVFVEANGGKERTFRMAPNGRLMVGGVTTDAQAMKPGMRVTITTQPNSSMATVIEAGHR